MNSTDRQAWQHEADLLADGRELLEKLCLARRYRHLYPKGPNLSLLLFAYQAHHRYRRFTSSTSRSLRRERRRFFRLIRQYQRDDAIARDRRLRWQIPPARLQKLPSPLPNLALRSLALVDRDVRSDITNIVEGRTDRIPEDRSSPAETGIFGWARLDRGLSQFASSLFHIALAHPKQILQIHPQILSLAASPQPTSIKHPVLTQWLVRVPLQLSATLFALLLASYSIAYFYFNDKLLGSFLTESIGTVIDGELAFESVHWGPSLIIDLLTGQPHRVEIYGVQVIEPFKREKLRKRRPTAYAEHLSVDLILHEIVPWNRLGILPMLDIPWILHFSHIENHGEISVDVREYLNAAGSEWKLGLVDSFRSPDDGPSAPNYKQLSIQIDSTKLQGIRTNLHLKLRQDWALELEFDELDLRLNYSGDYPNSPEPERLPFSYRIHAQGGNGSIQLLGRSVQLENLGEFELSSGTDHSPIGDAYLSGHGILSGSPSRWRGVLENAFGVDPSIDFRLSTADAGPLTQTFDFSDDPTNRPIIKADQARAALRIGGSLRDPKLNFVAQGISLDFQLDTAWIIDDVDINCTLSKSQVPGVWRSFSARAPLEWQPWILDIETFRGMALDGKVRLHPNSARNHIVVPDTSNDPLLASVHMSLASINLAQLASDVPKAYDLLQGTGDGEMDIYRLVYRGETPENEDSGDTSQLPPTKDVPSPTPSALATLELRLHDFQINRDNGPEDDGLPQQFFADGEILWDHQKGLNVRGLDLAIDGGKLSMSGHLDPNLTVFDQSSLQFSIANGETFFSKFSLPPLVQTLDTALQFSGPVAMPSGPEGHLSATGVGARNVTMTGIENARLWLDRGTLKLRSQNAELFGGKGPLEIDLVLGENGLLLSEPKIKAKVSLQEITIPSVMNLPLSIEGGEVTILVEDNNRRSVKFSQFEARGAAFARSLLISDMEYKNAESAFAITKDTVRIDRLLLARHRSISPRFSPDIYVPVGALDIQGLIGIQDDRNLDLRIRTNGLPLRALTSAFIPNLPIRGQLARGTDLHITGTVTRPNVVGEVRLDAINVAGIPLGRGQLEFTSNEIRQSSADSTSNHRELRISGQLQDSKVRGNKRVSADLQVEALFAFGTTISGASTSEADVWLNFARLPLGQLFAHPDLEKWNHRVDGAMQGLEIRGQYCPQQDPMLSTCHADPAKNRKGEEESVEVQIELESLWYRDLSEKHGSGKASTYSLATCPKFADLCSGNHLFAKLHGSRLQLHQPWMVHTGRDKRLEMEFSGEFDFESSLLAKSQRNTQCSEQQLFEAILPDLDDSQAYLRGEFDLAAIAPFLTSATVDQAKGSLDVDLTVTGSLFDPAVFGTIEHDDAKDHLELAMNTQSLRVPIQLDQFRSQFLGNRSYFSARAKLLHESMSIGEANKRPSYVMVSGPCQGSFRIANNTGGSIDGKLLQLLWPDVIRRSSGAISVEHLFAKGNFMREQTADVLDSFSTRFALGQRALGLEFPDVNLRVESGKTDFRKCTEQQPCNGRTTGYGVFIAGEQGASATSRPRSALFTNVGGRKSASAALWGSLYFSEQLDAALAGSLRASIQQFPYRQDDNSGRPELTAVLSSQNLNLNLDVAQTSRLSGDVLIERARWLRDVKQGVAVLSFEDPAPDQPSQLPDVLKNLALDLDLRTNAPFLVDNNVFHGLEGSAQLDLGGTLGNMELSGSLELEQGVLDLAILGGSYSIDNGRVDLNRDLSSTSVHLLATRKDPVKIDNELESVTLELLGSLDAIEWRCSSSSRTGGNAINARSCIDYVIFDAGNAAMIQSGVQRGSSAGLPVASRAWELVGNLTQREINDYFKETLPRVESYLPKMRLRLGQFGIESFVQTRPEWLSWGWGRIGFGMSYLRGFPSGLLRDSRSLSGRFELLENTAVELTTGSRTYTNRIFVLDPPSYQSIEFIQSLRIPSLP